MPKRPSIMAVSSKFDEYIRQRHKEFNRDFSQKYFHKNISLTKYTEIFCDIVEKLKTDKETRKKGYKEMWEVI